MPDGKWVKLPARPIDHNLSQGEHEAGAWAEPSFDPLVGAAVSYAPETLPGALLDELFPPMDDPRKKSEK